MENIGCFRSFCSFTKEACLKRMSLTEKRDTVAFVIFQKVDFSIPYIESTPLNLQMKKCLPKMTS
ncbi:hypothetical protein FH5_05521 [Priestia endophytica]|nr:hypothetical protein FH5_05521 [Priestia endophytica]